jgi:hypothetical protein
MIENSKNIESGSQHFCDYCIIGAGAAGIPLALELAQTGRKIILLEAGSKNRSGKSQDLYRGELANPQCHLPLDRDRYRQLGGTTAIWGGRCIPFDTIDFETRDYVPYSGWPIDKTDLDPFYRRAHEYCECGKYIYRSEEAFSEDNLEMIPGFVDECISTQTIERWSPPTHFGKVYRHQLEQDGHIQVLLNAICTHIEVSDDGRQVVRLEVSTLKGKRFQICPRIAILSGGGLEVTRLLLASNRIYANGIGNHSDWLGRGYMSHIGGVIAKAKFRENLDIIYGYEVDKDGIYCRRRLWISEEAQRDHQLLNMYILIDRPLMADPAHKSGIMSLTFLSKKIGRYPLQNLFSQGKYGLYWRHVLNILCGSPEILMVLPRWCRKRFIKGRRIPSLILKSNTNMYHLFYHTEQIPNRASRITLLNECDELGVPRMHLDNRITNTDAKSIYRAHQLLDDALRNNDTGYLIYESDDPIRQIMHHQATLGHHIGTTRMAVDPQKGVVDENCRVYGLSNLFIASSSVFPTSSQANPTLTIVALAIRLADHLKGHQQLRY